MKSDSKRVVPESNEDVDSDDNDKDKGQLEDVRKSNFAYSQTKIADYLSFYFAIIGVSSSIIASEISAGYDSDGSQEKWIKIMWIVTNISTFFLSNIAINLYSIQLSQLLLKESCIFNG